jgi:hypothetical protein
VLSLTSGLARFHFGIPEEAEVLLWQARLHLDGAPSVWHPPIVHQFVALASAAAYCRTDDQQQRQIYRERIEESLKSLKRLAKLNRVNFAHRVSLVEAALQSTAGKRAATASWLRRACEEAQDGAFINDVALAHELAADCGADDEAALKSLRNARTAYAAWGATAKVAQLSERIAALSN